MTTSAPTAAKSSIPRPLLALEFAILFALLPVALLFLPRVFPPLPLLWIVAAYCLVILRRDPEFDRSRLWNPAPLRANLPGILVAFVLICAFLSACVYFFAPQILFSFVRSRPVLWALVMVFYPIVSVYPQGLIYRVFLMHRYQPLASSATALIIASAAAFGLMHVVFRTPVAPALTSIGGLLFAWRYQRTQSLFVSSIEHALYGCFLFTIGLGQYFYARFV